MARFYASIQGNRGEATRMGTPSSGITGHVRGWNLGMKAIVDARCGDPSKDHAAASISGGSNGSPHPRVTLDAMERTDGGLEVTLWVEGSTVWRALYDRDGYQIREDAA